MSTNLFALFQSLIQQPPLGVGVITDIVDSSAIIELTGGGIITARGPGAIGDTVFVRDNVIEGPAPSLPVIEIGV